MDADEFDTIWKPRLGAEGAAELRRFRRILIAGAFSPWAALGGGALIAVGGAPEEIAGVFLCVVAASILVSFLLGIRRLGAVASTRFGVRIRAFPWNKRRFDSWFAAQGLQQPEER